MNENTVKITLDEYSELIRKAERVATLERMFERTPYLSDQEIKAVLDIHTEKEITK